MTQAESALERQLSRELMQRGVVPTRRRLKPGDTLVEQGEPGEQLYLLLDGVLAGGRRTATRRARTRCHVGVFPAEPLDRTALEQLTTGHHRES